MGRTLSHDTCWSAQLVRHDHLILRLRITEGCLSRVCYVYKDPSALITIISAMTS